jgi:hypothetical protein
MNRITLYLPITLLLVAYSASCCPLAAAQRLLTKLVATHNQEHFGNALDCADIDGDGRPDILVGAPGDEGPGGEHGAVYIYSGTDFHQIGVLRGPRAPGRRTGFGWSVKACDLNGDGVPEILVGGPYASAPSDGENSGEIWIFEGSTLSLLTVSTLPRTPGGLYGWSIACAGSIVAVGAPGTRARNGRGSGKVYLYDFANGIPEFPDAPAPLRTFTRPGDVNFGKAVALCDVDGDHVPDLVVGAPGRLNGRLPGRVEIFSGSTGVFLQSLSRMEGGDLFGASIVCDTTHLFIGAPGVAELRSGLPPKLNRGLEYLYPLPLPPDPRDFSFSFPPTALSTPGAAFGASLSLQDGFIAIGAPGADGGRGGAVFGAFHVTGERRDDHLGGAVAICNLGGVGEVDLIVAAPEATIPVPGGLRIVEGGAIYVYAFP